MMKRLSTFLALFFAIEAACAQTRPLVHRDTPLPPGITVIPPVSHKVVRGALQPQYTTVAQHVIPRYVSGATQPTEQPGASFGPAGQLVGWGPMSVLRGNAQTQRQKVKAVVTTEDFGTQTAQWSSGEFKQPNYRPAILRPSVRDCTIVGHDETRSNYLANGVVSGNPGKNNPATSFPDLYGGVFIQATGAHVENVTAFYIPGTAFLIARSGGTNTGPFGPWDSEKSIVRKCQAHRAYRGFDIQVVDAIVGQLQGYALRDYGVKFSAGAAQIDGAIHFWGVSPGPCVWFGAKAGACWGGPFYVEHAPLGMLIESSGNQLGPIYSKSCPEANIKLVGQRNVLGPIELDVANGATGVVVQGQFNKLLGGSITLHGTSAVGVRVTEAVNNGNGLVIRDVQFVGRSAAEGVAITTAHPLNNATIKAHIQNVGTGIELYPKDVSMLGVANDIDITTWSVTTPIRLPPTWHPSNRIRINGMLQEPGTLQR
jgi:hypothetical protein